MRWLTVIASTAALALLPGVIDLIPARVTSIDAAELLKRVLDSGHVS